jgi:3-carboxy-cis,cis-muconate cycloisomerase
VTAPLTDVRGALAPEARIQAMLDVEVALAESLAAEGLIPGSCVPAIRDAARAELYDAPAIDAAAAQAGNPAIPLIEMLTARVAVADPAAARYVHWGATSQDILDTGLVLQIRASMPSIQADLLRATAGAITLARQHADTPQVGRTWLQHATPITFGLKAAGWADALGRSRLRLARASDGALVLQFGGAAGTLAALGGRGMAVANALGARLDLRVPDLPWHAERDRLVELAAALGIAAGTLGKIARDIALLSQTELNEAYEAPAEGRGGSSSMPQKRNPVAASIALAAAVRAPGLVSTMLAAMPQEHERGLGGWQAEWDTLPELIRVVAGSAAALAGALGSLEVRPEAMAANLALTGGLANAEAVSIALAGHVGVRPAHQIVAAACREAAMSGRPLSDVLKADAAAMAHLTPAEVDALLVPDRYLGMARTFVERVLKRFDTPASGDA